MILVVGVSLSGVGLLVASFWRPFDGSLALGSDYRGHVFLYGGGATICIEEEGGQSLAQMNSGRDAVSGVRYLHRADELLIEMREQMRKVRQEVENRLEPPNAREYREMELAVFGTNELTRDQLVADLYQQAIAETTILPKVHGYAGLVFKFKSGSEERLVVSLPAWFLLILFLAAPGLFIFRIVRGRRRYSIMGCKQCGYDLTGNTSGRCPECGTVQAIPPPASGRGDS